MLAWIIAVIMIVAVIESLKTDLFADRVTYDENLKSQPSVVRRSAKRGGSEREEAQISSAASAADSSD